ncbi:MAG: hemolysin III family protein [Acidimicrobiia bacterium]|nr:hemolysin III family protein [Acidimicrobiia bacterium]
MTITRDEYSPSVRRVLELPRPRWRGVMHRWMVPVSVVAMIWLTASAESAGAAAVAALYGLASVGLYAVSATAHYKVWEPKRLHLLFQFDHSMIMIFMVASTAPVAYAVSGGTGWLLFGGMVVGVSAGLTAIWLPFHPPRGFMNTLFFMVGWWPVLFVVPIANGLGGTGIGLLLGGGAVFTIGALIVGSQRPNPNPHVFGYHEIWHIFVVLGNAIHYALVYAVVTGKTPF